MTDKLKCCFCGAELEDYWYEYENGHGDTEYAKSGLLKCPDWDCRGYKLKLEPEIWQTLIDGKRAQDALKVAINALKYVEKHEEDDYPNDVHYRIDLALRRITSITKGKDNDLGTVD